MAYTALNACDTFRNYLKEIGISDNNITLIPETKNRGIILTLDGLEKIVIFIYPIVSKQDGTKKYFDTRDSGPHERAKTWNYSIQNKLKYFCLGINDQVEKYKNYIFSLECNEKDIELLSGTEAGDRNGKGNQIIIPNDFTPNKSFQRIVNNLGTYIAVINKNDLISYLEKFDNRPYLLDKEEIDINNIQNISFYDSPNLNNLKGCNIIYYGVPGAGKSYTIEQDYKINDDSTVVQRVVFHPDYTYSDFVGQIMPKVETEKDTVNNTSFSRVSYEFKPGPFTNILESAIKNPNKQHILIIEEINRGNAPAIFGDLFQLLDRKEDGSSRYSINNSDIANVVYLDNFPEKKVYLPSNLTIVATMNTSDQNVFTLDTAFQRRWEMRLIENKFRSDHTFADKEILDTKVTWRTFCETMNRIIVGNGARTTSTEDKRLGVYFVKAQDIELGDKSVNQLRKFPEKVIKYLWDDAFKFNREDLFNTIYHSLEDVIEAFMGKTGPERFNIFKADIINQLNVVKETKQENTETLNEANQQ